jgi:hypothetical protein
MNTTKITIKALTGAAILAVALVGCSAATASNPVSTTGTTTAAVNMPAPTSTPTPTVAPTPTPTATPVADQYSQVISGKLYTGTASAPVRIGTDTPGSVPAAQAGLVRGTSSKFAEDNDKYLVYVFKTDGGWAWKVLGMSQYGSFRELGNNGYPEGQRLGSKAEAAPARPPPARPRAVPFTLDGRSLDRAEYLLATD